jgi:hypothetical protein
MERYLIISDSGKPDLMNAIKRAIDSAGFFGYDK